jgi:hypothetical protein
LLSDATDPVSPSRIFIATGIPTHGPGCPLPGFFFLLRRSVTRVRPQAPRFPNMSYVPRSPQKPSDREKTIPLEVQIQRQRGRIAELERAGRPTDFAKAFLAILERQP